VTLEVGAHGALVESDAIGEAYVDLFPGHVHASPTRQQLSGQVRETTAGIRCTGERPGRHARGVGRSAGGEAARATSGGSSPFPLGAAVSVFHRQRVDRLYSGKCN
jgi:hypothetical protein